MTGLPSAAAMLVIARHGQTVGNLAGETHGYRGDFLPVAVRILVRLEGAKGVTVPAPDDLPATAARRPHRGQPPPPPPPLREIREHRLRSRTRVWGFCVASPEPARTAACARSSMSEVRVSVS